MSWLWKLFPWRKGEAEAEHALEQAMNDRDEVEELVQELHRFEAQNHFAQSINKALGRGA